MISVYRGYVAETMQISRTGNNGARLCPAGGTGRSSFAKPACWNTPDAVELFHVLRLALCAQPRSNPATFGGSA